MKTNVFKKSRRTSLIRTGMDLSNFSRLMPSCSVRTSWIKMSSAPESLTACRGRAMSNIHREALTKSLDQGGNVSLDFWHLRTSTLTNHPPGREQ